MRRATRNVASAADRDAVGLGQLGEEPAEVLRDRAAERDRRLRVAPGRRQADPELPEGLGVDDLVEVELAIGLALVEAQGTGPGLGETVDRRCLDDRGQPHSRGQVHDAAGGPVVEAQPRGQEGLDDPLRGVAEVHLARGCGDDPDVRGAEDALELLALERGQTPTGAVDDGVSGVGLGAGQLGAAGADHAVTELAQVEPADHLLLPDVVDRRDGEPARHLQHREGQDGRDALAREAVAAEAAQVPAVLEELGDLGHEGVGHVQGEGEVDRRADGGVAGKRTTLGVEPVLHCRNSPLLSPRTLGGASIFRPPLDACSIGTRAAGSQEEDCRDSGSKTLSSRSCLSHSLPLSKDSRATSNFQYARFGKPALAKENNILLHFGNIQL